jgi:hypothetical protein
MSQHNVSFEALDTLDKEYNLLVASINGMVEAAEIEPGTDMDQIAAGTIYQTQRINKLIKSLFNEGKETETPEGN